jgi:RimJ/RimL family protein N-acetyltransferase
MTDTTDKPERALTADAQAPERLDLDGFHLRRLTLEDAPGLHDAVVASYPELHAWMPWCVEPVDIKDQREFLERSAADWTSSVAFNWGVFDAEDRFSGTLGLMDRIGPGGLEIGYWLRTDVTGRGLMTTAVRAVTEVGLGLPGITRVEIHCDAANTRSAGVPRRLGYRLAREVPREVTAPGETGTEQYWVTP